MAVFGHELRKESLVLLRGLFPAECFGGPLVRFAGQFLTKIRISQKPRDSCREVSTISAEGHPAFARGFAVLRRIKVEDGHLRGHGFNERGMHATDFASENVKAGVSQELPIATAVDRTEENYAAIGKRFQPLDVGRIVGIAPDNDQRPIGLHSAIGVEQKLGIVFWFEAADVQDEPLRRQIEKPGRRLASGAVCWDFRAISDECRTPSIMAPVVFFHNAGVGNDARGSERREELTQIQRRAADQVPFFALAIEAIDVQSGGLSDKARNPGNRTIGNVANENHVCFGEADMNQREERVEGSIEVFARNGGQNDASNSRSDHVIGRGERPAAVYCDFVAARRQARRKLFGERLKTAVARRNAARPENRYLHVYPNIMSAHEPGRRSSPAALIADP
jgi:hypothetical protein